MGIRKYLLVVAIAAVVAGAGYLLYQPGAGSATSPPDPTGPSAGRAPAGAIAPHGAPPTLDVAVPDGTAAPGALRLEGTVIDADHHPVGGAAVTLDGRRAVTTDDGAFAFDQLTEGDHRITAEKDVLYAEDVVTVSADSGPAQLTLKPGATLVLHVVAGGQPVAGAQVKIAGRTAETDRTGTARIRGVELGSALVHITAPRYAPLIASVDTGDDPHATVEKTIALAPGAPVSGVVVDQDGTPVPGAALRYHFASDGWGRWLDADAQGRWQLDRVPAGKLILRASSPLHIATPDLAVVVDGERPRTDVVVRVALGATVSGIVVDASGKPVADASVSVGRSTQSDEAGRFEITGLEAGPAELSAHTPTQASVVRKLDIPERGHLEVRIEVTDSTIAGRVTNPRGEPVAGATIRATYVGDVVSRWATSDELGNFDLGGLPPGDYELVAARDGDRDAQPRPMVVHAGNRSVAIVLREPAAITGRVVLDGKPVDYFGVALTDDPERAYSTPDVVRAPDGRFTEAHLPPGTWSIAIVGPAFLRKVITGVQVAEGRTTELGDIAVERGRTVSGRVRDSRGLSIAGARVTISASANANDEVGLGMLASGARVARSDADGTYRIDGIERDGDGLRIGATTDQGIAAPAPLEPTATAVDLVIEPTGAIRGVVAHERGHTAVFARSAAGSFHFTWTDPDHEFAFDRLPPGEYTVEIHHSTESTRVIVAGGATTRIELAAPDLPPDPTANPRAHLR